MMYNDRLTKKIFIHDYNRCTNNWTFEIREVMFKLGLTDYFINKSSVDMSYVKLLITDYYGNVWSRDIQNVPKLRSYKRFKHLFGCEQYVVNNLKKYERSILCQFRCGILPIRIETGRYIGETPEQRLCRFCDTQSVEDEIHFFVTLWTI